MITLGFLLFYILFIYTALNGTRYQYRHVEMIQVEIMQVRAYSRPLLLSNMEHCSLFEKNFILMQST